MLDAVVGNKTRKHKGKGFSEDEITSTFFGPLAFMAPADLWWAVQEIGLVKPSDDFAREEPLTGKVKFWERLPYETKNVEPDVIIDLKFEELGLLRLVVEVKWNAGASDLQLLKQWTAARQWDAEGAPKAVHHCYLTKSLSEAHSELKDTSDHLPESEKSRWRSNAIGLTWFDVASSLERLHLREPLAGRERWARSGRDFLEKLGNGAFRGFSCYLDGRCFEAAPYRFNVGAVTWPEAHQAVTWPEAPRAEPFKFEGNRHVS